MIINAVGIGTCVATAFGTAIPQAFDVAECRPLRILLQNVEWRGRSIIVDVENLRRSAFIQSLRVADSDVDMMKARGYPAWWTWPPELESGASLPTWWREPREVVVCALYRYVAD